LIDKGFLQKHHGLFSNKGKIGIFTQSFIMGNIPKKGQIKKKVPATRRKPVSKPIVYISVFLLLVLLMAVIFNPDRRTPNMKQIRNTSGTSGSSEPTFNKQGELSFLKTDGSVAAKIDIEIADDEAKRERGLMYRRQMDMDHGMLFVFDEEDQRSFWMKNTYLPLDILYLNAQRKIVKIHENVAILNEMPVPSEFPAKYVVELNAGFCALYRLQVGDGINFTRK
jgi:uncharacterized membrane protein (UPF0127 family)